MFDNLINKNVTIVVSTKSEMLLEYNGVLVEENESIVKLENVNINNVMLNFQKNIFGGNISVYKENLESVILNKKYIISCSIN